MLSYRRWSPVTPQQMGVSHKHTPQAIFMPGALLSSDTFPLAILEPCPRSSKQADKNDEIACGSHQRHRVCLL